LCLLKEFKSNQRTLEKIMKKRPHILLFNPDQMRADALGHLGNGSGATPNLDHLVETEAVSFSQAYCQNPVCTPSRCSFMTGWYPHVRGHRTMYHMLHHERGEPNLQRKLKDNDYYVWWTSRNDLVPGQFGYGEECDTHCTAGREDLKRWEHFHRANLHSDRGWRGEPDSDTFYSFYVGKLDRGKDSLYADVDWGWILGAREFIRNYDGEKPLFINLSLAYPHPPYGVEDPWYGQIDRSKIPPRVPVPEGWKGKPAILREIWQRQGMRDWTEERWLELRATYLGQCARVDHQFQLILDSLKEKGFYEDTAIFIFSDHGDFTGDYGLVEKTQNTFEDCLTHVPFIIKPPHKMEIAPGVRQAMIELIDFPATVYDLTGIDPGYNHFGRSLLPLLADDKKEHREAVFCEGGRRFGEEQAMEKESLKSNQDPQENLYWPRLSLQITDDGPFHGKAVMCRTPSHKYVRRLYEKDELYDLEKDPQELHNRIDDPSFERIRFELKERMTDWYMETCDVVPYDPDRRFWSLVLFDSDP
jgi:arylsulfatase A-like enzyme